MRVFKRLILLLKCQRDIGEFTSVKYIILMWYIVNQNDSYELYDFTSCDCILSVYYSGLHCASWFREIILVIVPIRWYTLYNFPRSKLFESSAFAWTLRYVSLCYVTRIFEIDSTGCERGMYANRIYSAVARIRKANVCERESDLRRTHPYFTTCALLLRE